MRKRKIMTEEDPFTFSRKENDFQEDLNSLYDKMKEFESQVVTMIKNQQKDAESLAQQLDDRLSQLEYQKDSTQQIRNELDNIKGLNEALEEERKKDILRSKKFVEDHCQELLSEYERQRDVDRKDLDK